MLIRNLAILTLAVLLTLLGERLLRRARKGPAEWSALIVLAVFLVILVATVLGSVLDIWFGAEPRPWRLA